MAYTLLSELNKRSQKCVIEVKILRLWNSVNPRANNQRISSDLLAIDREGSAIQCVIKPADISAYEEVLAENKIFIISKFLISDRKKYYNVVPNPLTLNFIRTTQIVESKSEPTIFADHYYNFAAYEGLENRIRNNTILSDVMGFLIRIGNAVKMPLGSNAEEVLRRNLEIRMPSNDIIRVTLWGDFAEQLEEEHFLGELQSTIVVFAAMTVSKYMGQITISTCSASRIVVNPDIPYVREIKERFHCDNAKIALLSTGYEAQLSQDEAKIMNRLNIQQLMAIDTSEAVDKRFTCEARIIELDASQGWFYNSCSECNKTVIPCDDKYWCPEHNERVPTPKCKLPIIIEDETGILQVIFFGNPEKRLVSGSMMSLIALANGDPMTLPEPLKNLENQKRIFQIYMSRQSLSQSEPLFIVSTTFHIPTPAHELKALSAHLEVITEPPATESPAKKQKKSGTTAKGKEPAMK